MLTYSQVTSYLGELNDQDKWIDVVMNHGFEA